MTMKRIPMHELPPSLRASLELAAEELHAEGERLEKKYGKPVYIFASLANRLASLAGLIEASGNKAIADLVADVAKDFAPVMVAMNIDPAKACDCLQEIEAASERQSASIFAAQEAIAKMTQGEKNV